MKFAQRCAALGLSAALLLSTSAQAADPAEARAQDLEQLYDTLKRGHPNLFANTPETVFLARKAEIEETLATASDWDFVLDLQSLAALAHDSHTTTSLRQSEDMHLFPFALKWFNGVWVLATAPVGEAGRLGACVTAINGVPMDQVLERFQRLVSADNPVKLRRQTTQMLYVGEILSYLGLTEPGGTLTLTFAEGEPLTLEALAAGAADTTGLAYLANQRESRPATAYDKTKYYFSLPLNENTYYIQYNRCQEDPELPMEVFAAQVDAALSAGHYGQVLLDLRNNGGGSDGVIWPLLDLLAPMVRSGSVRVYGLVGESTFSSAIINAVMIREMGGILAGSPTSGSVNHFGSTRSFTLEHSGIRVSYSTKWINLGTLLEAGLGQGVEPLSPEVAVAPTLADDLAGRDTEVEYLLAHGDEYQASASGQGVLTRGRFLTQLMEAAQAAGLDCSAPGSGFQDVLSFAYYVPAVNWAAHNGLVKGGGQGAVEPVRPLTRAEAAVLLARYADYLGLARNDSTRAGFTDAAEIPGWALEAAGWAVSAGLMETADGAFAPSAVMTVSDGISLAARLHV